MSDRIADPWGACTPHAIDTDWPVRVDEYTEHEPDRWVQSACVLCSNGCALDIGVADGRIVGVRGRAGDRINHGRLGPKGLYGWQANNSPDRLTRPLVRRNDTLEETDWDTAMDAVVERARSLLNEKGPGAFGFYTTGQLFIEDYYTLAVLARGGIGTNHVDGNTRLCTATAGASLKETFGSDGQPGTLADIDHCDTLLHVGINIAETQTVSWARTLDRLHGPDRPRLVVIDPRPTQAAKEADVHLPLRNGTNVAILNALIRELIENGWIDQ
jgi:anaerobic selenocysteine-containing dehydrogenase